MISWQMISAAPSCFLGKNFQKNFDLVSSIEAVAIEMGCTHSQRTLAWVLAQGNDIAAIRGT